MPSALLANMRARWDEISAQMSVITDAAARENRDLNDVERANFEALQVQLTEVTPRIQQLVDVDQSIDATAQLFAGITGEGRGELARQEAPSALSVYRSAGEYLYDLVLSRGWSGSPDPDARSRIQRAVANVTTSEITAVVPEPVIGDVWSVVDAARRLVGTFTQRQITSPLMFRPKVFQHTQVGLQGTAGVVGSSLHATNDEKKELVSRAFKLSRINIEPKAVGGAVDVSLWAEMFSPGLLDIIVSDLAEQYAIMSEAVAGTELNRAGTASGITALTTVDAQTFNTALYAAAAKVYSLTGRLPDYVAMSPDVWAQLGGIVDASKRPLMPALAPQNAPGQMNATSFAGSPNGLRQVVTNGLPAKSLIVYVGSGFEFFERRIGVLQVIEPELVGRLVSYSGLVTAIAMDDGAAVKIPLP